MADVSSLLYTDFAAACERLESTTKRLETTSILAELLEAAPPDDLGLIAWLLQGKVAPDWEGVELGLAEKMILRVLGQTTTVADPLALYHEVGDLGLTAERALAAGSGAKQATLFGPEDANLTVRDVFDRLSAIAAETGKGSQDRKQQQLAVLLQDATPLGARYIIRTVAGRLRLGVADMTFLDAATAWHLGKRVRSVTEMDEDERAEHEQTRGRLERAYDVCTDLARVIETLRDGGLDALDALDVSVGVPLRPMAAERLKTLEEILEKHDGRSALEYKYDGLRMQAHIPPTGAGAVRLFSRRMEELTAQFPDVCAMLAAAADKAGKAGKHGGLIVECETVAVDPDTGAMRPFQDVSRRRGRKRDLPGATVQTLAGNTTGKGRDITQEIPVAVFLFDALAADGQGIMAEPYTARRSRLEGAFRFDDRVRLATMQVCEDAETMGAFFQQAVADGAEGIMCKAPDHPYKAGNRGYDWIKFKTDYTAELVDSMDLVVIGAFMGRGRRAGCYGALLMAAYDPDADSYPSVCKLGTGFDDETLKSLKDRFADHESAERPPGVVSDMQPDIWLSPTIVMEVEAAEITLSPIHKAAWGDVRAGAGFAARFPRFTGRWRDDKAPDQATTTDELRVMYDAQSKT